MKNPNRRRPRTAKQNERIQKENLDNAINAYKRAAAAGRLINKNNEIHTVHLNIRKNDLRYALKHIRKVNAQRKKDGLKPVTIENMIDLIRKK